KKLLQQKYYPLLHFMRLKQNTKIFIRKTLNDMLKNNKNVKNISKQKNRCICIRFFVYSHFNINYCRFISKGILFFFSTFLPLYKSIIVLTLSSPIKLGCCATVANSLPFSTDLIASSLPSKPTTLMSLFPIASTAPNAISSF